jgi:hypothetical protein
MLGGGMGTGMKGAQLGIGGGDLTQTILNIMKEMSKQNKLVHK